MAMRGERMLKSCHLSIRDRWSDRIYYTFCFAILALLTIAILYPLIYILSASFSTAEAVVSGRMWLWPVDFTLTGYRYILSYKYIWVGYRNTIFYTTVGTTLGVFLTLICAYPLSRKSLRGQNLFMLLFTITMIFQGGMIPNYILIKNLKLIDTFWAMLFPGCMTAYNMIITRTFLRSTIPDELHDAARIDGCSDFRFFFSVVLPLSTTIIAVNALFYASFRWNSYFDAFLYLNSKNLYPLQIFLRQLLVQSNFTADMLDPEAAVMIQTLQDLLKYTIIVVSSLPMIALYPFAQKYFKKGVMIGAIKG
jgi:putative aldouronate transport system permease protein